MNRRLRFHVLLTALSALLLGACGAGPAAEATATPVMPATEPATATVSPPTATASPTATATATPEPSATPTSVPQVSVSENTNCRQGPATNYLFQGVLAVGQSADVLARNEASDYLYIANPDQPGEGCWLWGEFAQVQGDVAALPVFTPAPSPTPAVDFEITLRGFESCGPTFYVVFAVRNVGGERFWSGYAEVRDTDKAERLFYSALRHPFAATVLPVCPPDHGNELWPGELRYVHVPLSPVVSGDNALGTITLCTADFQGGTCLTRYSYFQLP